MDDSRPLKVNRRWYRLTPDRFLLALLPIVGLLFLSERFRWFAFNEHKNWTVLIAVAVVCVAVVLLLLWLGISLVSRLRFQFSIRSLMLFVAVVAVVCSWFSVRMQQARKQREAVEVVRLVGTVVYDYAALPDHRRQADPWAPIMRRITASPDHGRLGKWLGVDFFSDVVEVEIHGPRPEFDDAGLEHLKGLTSLRHLLLITTQVTDAGLEHLKGLTHLHSLNLACTQVTDAGLIHLKGLTSLQSLSLYDTLMTDAGLEHLKGLTHLHSLNLARTRVTFGGVKKLQKVLPNCDIYYYPLPPLTERLFQEL